MSYRFHADGACPVDGEIWVFGSNLSGIHGAGAAKVARFQFGAALGMANGPTGNSYAIPTKGKRAADRSFPILPLEELRWSVVEFTRYAAAHPELTFFVTRIGCGLAGYRDDQVAPMFAGAPSNCVFPEPWQAHLRARPAVARQRP